MTSCTGSSTASARTVPRNATCRAAGSAERIHYSERIRAMLLNGLDADLVAYTWPRPIELQAAADFQPSVSATAEASAWPELSRAADGRRTPRRHV
jgi:hypothetical protein